MPIMPYQLPLLKQHLSPAAPTERLTELVALTDHLDPFSTTLTSEEKKLIMERAALDAMFFMKVMVRTPLALK